MQGGEVERYHSPSLAPEAAVFTALPHLELHTQLLCFLSASFDGLFCDPAADYRTGYVRNVFSDIGEKSDHGII